MQQSLISLDFGNTNPHAGLFRKQDGQWELLEVVPLHDLVDRVKDYDISAHNAQLVLCEVKEYPEEVLALQSQGYLLTRVKDYWRGERFAGMPVHYAKTLGEDRLINAFLAYKKIKNPTLIIDAGTYLTIDVVTTDGFLGGYIIPSHQKFLETFTDGENLKDISLSENSDLSLPHTSEDAMSSSYHAFCALAEKLIADYQLTTIVISGGKDSLWKEWAQTMTCEVIYEPHLIHKALINWMTTQVEIL